MRGGRFLAKDRGLIENNIEQAIKLWLTNKAFCLDYLIRCDIKDKIRLCKLWGVNPHTVSAAEREYQQVVGGRQHGVHR